MAAVTKAKQLAVPSTKAHVELKKADATTAGSRLDQSSKIG